MSVITASSLRTNRAARVWFGLTAIVALSGIVVQVIAAVQAPTGEFDGALARTFNVFCYFTVLSNVLVVASTGLLAVGLRREQTWFRVVRLTAVVSIAVTFLVYQTVLRGLRELTGLDVYADAILHAVSPVMCVAGWLLFGPRGLIDRRVVVMTLIFPLAWAAFTLLRGPLVDFYPYPFIDVDDLGYARVLVNVVLVGALFLALAGAASWLDRRLPTPVVPIDPPRQGE